MSMGYLDGMQPQDIYWDMKQHYAPQKQSTDPVNATVIATSFDSHVETDRLGSSAEYSR
jgi:hypothetical protein